MEEASRGWVVDLQAYARGAIHLLKSLEKVSSVPQWRQDCPRCKRTTYPNLSIDIPTSRTIYPSTRLVLHKIFSNKVPIFLDPSAKRLHVSCAVGKRTEL